MTRQNIRRSIKEIYEIYRQRSYNNSFTLESIPTIFEIGNEIFVQNNEEEIENIINHPPSNAPDIMDDEPYSLDRSLEIFEKLNTDYQQICPELIQRIFEVNSKLAWQNYKVNYKKYILDICDNYKNDEYINYLAAVLFFEDKNYKKAVKCLNFALSQNSSCSLFAYLKGLSLVQLGEFDSARTYLYQALFLIELLQDVPPRLKGNPEIYPNYPIEYHTAADLVRQELNKLDQLDAFYDYSLVPVLEELSVQ